MHALRMREIKKDGHVVADLLLELRIRGVNSGVCVVTTEYANTTETWERIIKWTSSTEVIDCVAGTGTRCDESRPGGRRHAKRDQLRAHKNRLLLDTIGSDRPNLRQHVLTSVVNSIARSEHRLPFFR